jgi:homopolymeric O-antigen transport system ATP-binding protein
MSDTVISIEGLGKKYQIQHQQDRPRYVALRDLIAEKARSLFKTLVAPPAPEDFWALKDVSFGIGRGEVVGIIGRNGAGKSTLLKILSRITEPTEGRVRIKGGVASLLEVGTGFHPELTGRENIFLNGAILGMKRQEIKCKFDEIVAFAEAEKFLDTPVKRYSSGMYVRLAFAVAAHLEPEILIVDEVLAVGDAQFQRKCLGKMGEVAKGGRTVLFVSHQLAAVRRFCSRGLLLANGRLVFDGPAPSAIDEYIKTLSESQVGQTLDQRKDREGSGRVRFQKVCITNANCVRQNRVSSGDAMHIRIWYSNLTGKDIQNVAFHVAFDSPVFGRVFMCQSNLVGKSITARADGGEIVLTIPRLPLTAGFFTGNLFSAIDGAKGEVLDFVRQAFVLEVEQGDFFSTGQIPTGGVFLVDQLWKDR